MQRILLLFPCLLLVFGGLNAQHRQCGSMEVLARQLQENPALKNQMDAIEEHAHNFIQNGGATERAVITIPVVVHVVWNTTAQNVSDQQIQSQIDVLNADFRKLNADASLVPAAFAGLAADCEINFCLAQQTPTGAATNGIERRQTTITSFGTNDAVKYYSQGGLNVWDRTKYLNLWVCKLSGGVLGYAQFPGGPAATDGVVITNTAFGTIGSATAPFNKGRTGTHEVGHWLNLYHIWGDDGTACTGSDNCADTPNQADENYGCPAFPTVSCSNGPNGDMFMNYMDYTDDACMYMFTLGQKARAQALFASGGSRASLATSPGCTAGGGGGTTCGTAAGLNATAIAQTTATLNWTAVSGATAYNLQWKVGTSSTWTTVSNLTATTYNLTGLTANTAYNFQVQTVCGTASAAYSAAATFTTLPTSTTCTDNYEPNESRTASALIPVNTNITAKIATSTDKDWFRFANTSTQRNIRIDLTTLPADYDVKLFKGSTQVAISQNTGTTSEVIIYNTTSSATTYYANVYGYQGANSASCYTLRASISASAFRTDGSAEGAVEEIELDAQFVNEGFGMYPNPTSGNLTVEVPMTDEAEVQISVIDPAGKTVAQLNETLGKASNIVNIDLSTVSTGIYFVQVRNGESVATRKLVVQK